MELQKLYNLEVRYSPFLNTNKVNNKWYVKAKIMCIYFEFFWCPKKHICFSRKEILKEGKSAIFYLNSLDFQIVTSGKKSIDKKRNVYYRHLGIFCDFKTTY